MLAPAVPGRALLAARLETSQKALALRGANVSARVEELKLIILTHCVVDFAAFGL